MLAVATPTGDPQLVESPWIAVVITNTTATLVFFWYDDRLSEMAGRMVVACNISNERCVSWVNSNERMDV